jgi:hypothetical protein
MRSCLLVVACLATACGSSPGGPTPSPSPTATSGPPGPVAGAYELQLAIAADCGLGAQTFVFDADAAAAGTTPHPGLQVLIPGGASFVEGELLLGTGTVRGGFGTTADGALASGLRVWVRAIGSGAITRARDGRGEIPTGNLTGYIAMGGPNDEEGALGSCTSANHSFSLKVR